MLNIRALAAMAAMAAPGLIARGEPSNVAPRAQHPKNPRLNRSQKWPFARTYKEAREMSPSDRPVR